MTQSEGCEALLGDITTHWRQALESLRPSLLADQLEQAAIHGAQFAALPSPAGAISGPDRLVATFPPKYTSYKTLCEKAENVSRLERALERLAGRPIGVEFRLLERSESDPAAEPRARIPSSQERLAARAREPFVQRAIELFDARPYRLDGAVEPDVTGSL